MENSELINIPLSDDECVQAFGCKYPPNDDDADIINQKLENNLKIKLSITENTQLINTDYNYVSIIEFANKIIGKYNNIIRDYNEYIKNNDEYIKNNDEFIKDNIEFNIDDLNFSIELLSDNIQDDLEEMCKNLNNNMIDLLYERIIMIVNILKCMNYYTENADTNENEFTLKNKWILNVCFDSMQSIMKIITEINDGFIHQEFNGGKTQSNPIMKILKYVAIILLIIIIVVIIIKLINKHFDLKLPLIKQI